MHEANAWNPGRLAPCSARPIGATRPAACPGKEVALWFHHATKSRGSIISSITLKNIPEALHQRLRESAARNHRSINGEMLAALDQYVSQQRPGKAQLLANTRTLRQETALYVTEEEIDRAKREGRP